MADISAKKFELRSQLLLSLAAAAVVMLFVQDVFGVFKFFDRLSLSALDRLYTNRGASPLRADSLDVVIVALSDKTERSLPQKFPFPRNYYARAIRNLNAAGARAIGIDLLFEQREQSGGRGDSLGARHDAELFDAIRSAGNVVVAAKTEMRAGNAEMTRSGENFHTIFYAADSAVGNVYVPNDEDGIYRRYMPYAAMPGGGTLIPSFAFGVLNQYFHLSPAAVAADDGSTFVYNGERIRAYDETSILVNFYGVAGRTFRQIDFADILDDSTFETTEERDLHESINTFDDPGYGILHDGSLAGKVVLIGPYFPESKDLIPVPIAPHGEPDHNLMYGVEYHANVIQMMLHRNYLHIASQAATAVVVFLIALCVTAVVSSLRRRAARYTWGNETIALLFCCALLAAAAQSTVVMFSSRNTILPVVPLMASVLLAYAATTVHYYLGERQRKVMIQKMFTHYLNPFIVNELIAHPEKLRLGGERKELTVLFADVGGFTTLSEHLPPEEIVSLLNEYLGAMSEIILAHNGTLDKYEGDAIMAFWGAPIPLENGALDACRAALAMCAKVKSMRTAWKDEGKPEFPIRIGINTGEMIVGNMGSAARFDYTVIGDSVNIASRLEGANKEYRTTVMISERTAALVKDELFCREVDDVMVIGRSQSIKVFEPLGPQKSIEGSPVTRALQHYTRGLVYYRIRQFNEALASFQTALDCAPDDGPAQVYLARTKHFLETPPPHGWNGVHTLQSK
jgi:adenylate cyclase